MEISCPFIGCNETLERSEDILPHLKFRHYEEISTESVVKPFGPGHKGILIQGRLKLDQDQPTTVAYTGTDGVVIVTLKKSSDAEETTAKISAFNVFPKPGTKITSKFMLKNLNTEDKLTFKGKLFDYESCEDKIKEHAIELSQEEREKFTNEGSIFFHLEYFRKKIPGEMGCQVVSENRTETVVEQSDEKMDHGIKSPEERSESPKERCQSPEERSKSPEEISSPKGEPQKESDNNESDEEVQFVEVIPCSSKEISKRKLPSIQCPIQMCSQNMSNAKEIIPHIKEKHVDEVSYPSSFDDFSRGIQLQGVLFHPGIHPIVIAETSKCGDIVLAVSRAPANLQNSPPSYNLHMYNTNPAFKTKQQSELILRNPHNKEGHVVFRNRLFDYCDGKDKMTKNKMTLSEVELKNIMLDDVINFELNTGIFCHKEVEEMNEEIEIELDPDEVRIVSDADEDFDDSGNGSEDSGPVTLAFIHPAPRVIQRTAHNEDDDEMDWIPGTTSRKAGGPRRRHYVSRMAVQDPYPEEGDSGSKFSNNMKEACKVRCVLCDEICFMVGLRSHTKRKHGLCITEYKEQFGELLPIENIYHRCGICGKTILLDSDHVAKHLKGPGHNITHKHYNMQYMTTRNYL